MDDNYEHGTVLVEVETIIENKTKVSIQNVHKAQQAHAFQHAAAHLDVNSY